MVGPNSFNVFKEITGVYMVGSNALQASTTFCGLEFKHKTCQGDL